MLKMSDGQEVSLEMVDAFMNKRVRSDLLIYEIDKVCQQSGYKLDGLEFFKILSVALMIQHDILIHDHLEFRGAVSQMQSLGRKCNECFWN